MLQCKPNRIEFCFILVIVAPLILWCVEVHVLIWSPSARCTYIFQYYLTEAEKVLLSTSSFLSGNKHNAFSTVPVSLFHYFNTIESALSRAFRWRKYWLIEIQLNIMRVKNYIISLPRGLDNESIIYEARSRAHSTVSRIFIDYYQRFRTKKHRNAFS